MEQKEITVKDSDGRITFWRRKTWFTTNRNLAIILLGLLAIGGIAYLASMNRNSARQEEVVYYCPMHPNVRSNKPGDCPICGMALVPLKGSTGREMDTAQGVLLPRAEAVRANVAVLPVQQRDFFEEITVPGRIRIAEPNEHVVVARAKGRIEQLYANATGDHISRGDALYEIYSPDLLNAQQEYLIALGTKPHEISGGIHSHSNLQTSLVTAARNRLLLYGLTDQQIEHLEHEGGAAPTAVIHATRSGTVIQKYIQEGAYVDEGTTLFQLADLSNVWVEMEVGQEAIGPISRGTPVTIMTAYSSDQKLIGRIIFLSPVANESTRTVMVRAAFSNPGNQLRPGMTLTATILINQGRKLAIPSSAVVRTGREDYVWLQTEAGSFVPRVVTLGALSPDGYYQVLGGLMLNDPIAVTGSFLIDSEHQLFFKGPTPSHDAHRGDKEAIKQIITAEATGIVRAIDPAKQQITIDHGEIPGIMSAMEMPFRAKDPAMLNQAKVGMRVKFTIAETDGGRYEITSITKY